MVQVVYRALLGADFTEAVDRLRAAGLHPVALDDTNPDPALIHAARGTLRIRVAVPQDEVARAVRVLSSMGRMPESTRRLVSSFERSCLLYVGVGTALGIAAALAYRVEPDFPWQVPALAIFGAWTVFLWIRARRRAGD